ncbi:MAG: hypothetical protein IPI73_25905 [Betaproteobacteria bacterium]|nr:hypothetical protein [Betaproteobacteria bacterium]
MMLPRMRIEHIEVFGVAVPLAGEYTTAYESRTVQRSVVVRITASGGAIGLGNVDPVPGYSTETADQTVQALKGVFAPSVLGGDPANIHVLNQRLAAAGRAFSMPRQPSRWRVSTSPPAPWACRCTRILAAPSGTRYSSTAGSASCRRSRPRRKLPVGGSGAFGPRRSRLAEVSSSTANA